MGRDFWSQDGGGGGGVRDLTSVFLVDRVGSGPGWLAGWLTGRPYKAKVSFSIVKQRYLQNH